MCSQHLWRVVRRYTPRYGSQRDAAGCRLGPWAASLSKAAEPNLVLAIDVRTYFTVAFQFGDEASFHEAFGGALGAALEDLGVSSGQAFIEVAAVTRLHSVVSATPACVRHSTP
jgi:hypothetical protein